MKIALVFFCVVVAAEKDVKLVKEQVRCELDLRKDQADFALDCVAEALPEDTTIVENLQNKTDDLYARLKTSLEPGNVRTDIWDNIRSVKENMESFLRIIFTNPDVKENISEDILRMIQDDTKEEFRNIKEQCYKNRASENR